MANKVENIGIIVDNWDRIYRYVKRKNAISTICIVDMALNSM